jgi:hypothetical protein
MLNCRWGGNGTLSNIVGGFGGRGPRRGVTGRRSVEGDSIGPQGGSEGEASPFLFLREAVIVRPVVYGGAI